MKERSKVILLVFVFAALVALLDQFFKRWIMITISSGGETVVIPRILNLIYVRNYGAAFGIFSGNRWPLAGVMLLVVIVLIIVLLRYNGNFWARLGLAAVLGGGVGNLFDRVVRGYVVDMFELQFVNFAIFNIADIFITLGGILFIVGFIASSVRSDRGDEDDNIIDFPLSYDDDEEEYDETIPILPKYHDPAIETTSESPPPSEYVPDMDFTLDLGNDSGIDTSKLSETSILEDYDLDRLLRDYGLEDDSD